MKQAPTSFTRAAMLLAAAALPLAPVAAQEAQPPADPPASTQPAPQPQAQVPAAQTGPAPVEIAAPPAPADEAPPAAAPATRRAPSRTVTRTTTTVRSAPAPVPVGTAPVAVVTSTPVLTGPGTTTAVPPPIAPGAVEVLPAAPSGGTDVVAVETEQQGGGTPVWPWLVLAGLLLLAGGLLFIRRRRPSTTIVEDHAYEERRISDESSLAPAPVVAPLAAAPLAAAAAIPAGTPRIELSMHPVRAGIAGADARVEFQLTVANRGDAVAEEVRISTWMLASGSSEMERALIEPREAADTPPVTIEPGQSRTLEAAVALPTADLKSGSVLPVVVADAHYRLPDGSQRHTRVSYAVGVPDGEELAHFSVEHPSGLHEGVVAQELERARMV
jgi:LPXTG-motif cell wall-anchored protein